MRRCSRILLALLVTLALDWHPSTPPLPQHAASAQLPSNAVQGGTLQNAATATGNGSNLDTSNATAVVFQTTISGTSATVAYEGSTDNATFFSLTCYTLDSQTSLSSSSATQTARCNVLGIPVVRARISACSSCTVTVKANASSAGFPNVRDSTSPSGAITGQLRGTQTTAPTCATSINNITNACQVSGTDSFVRGLIGNPVPSDSNAGVNMIVTFNTAYAAPPSCVATWDGNGAYGYYIYAVTPTTTTATLKLGGGKGTQRQTWSPGDAFSLLCAGVQ